MTQPTIANSEIVRQLANLASQGTFRVDPAGARNMNTLFALVAGVINELEATEAAADADVADALGFEEELTEEEPTNG